MTISGPSHAAEMLVALALSTFPTHSSWTPGVGRGTLAKRHTKYMYTQSHLSLNHSSTSWLPSANVVSPQLLNMAEALVKQILFDALQTPIKIV